MNNVEELEKITILMSKVPLDTESLQSFYLGFMTKYLAQIADSLNEIKDAIKEQEDGKEER